MFFTNSDFELLDGNMGESPFVKMINEKLLNGNLLVAQFKDQSAQPFRTTYIADKSKFMRELFQCSSFLEGLHKLKVTYNKTRFSNDKTDWTPDGLPLLNALSRRAFHGGCYPRDSNIAMIECIRLSLDFIENNISRNMDKLHVVSTYDTFWTDWFHLGYETDSYFCFDHEKNILTMILVRDSD